MTDDLAVVGKFFGPDLVREIAEISRMPLLPREAFANALADAVQKAFDRPVQTAGDTADEDVLFAIGRLLGREAVREIAAIEKLSKRAVDAFRDRLWDAIETASSVAEFGKD